MKLKLIPIAIVALLASCSQSTDNAAPAAPTSNTENALPPGQEAVNDGLSQPNILQIALGSADHTTLVAAVKAAEQTTALANNGPLTVFAPTNTAFEALPAGTVETLLKPENKMQLISIIQNHAAPGSYKIDQLKDGQNIFVASGGNVKIERRDDGVYANGAKILASVSASNGLVHVVDKVILPN